MKMILTVQSREELEEIMAEATAQGKLVVIDFYANWCGPCKIVGPKLEELAVLYVDKACMVKVNVDDNEEIALDYNVSSLPTFVFVKNNQIIDAFIGGNTEKLVKSVEKFVGEVIIAAVDDVDENIPDVGAEVELSRQDLDEEPNLLSQ